MPKNIGTAKSSLYGPESADKPVMERDVFYIRRGKRSGVARMIGKPKRLVKYICIIGIRNRIAFTMYGINSKKPSLTEIWYKKFKSLSHNEQK